MNKALLAVAVLLAAFSVGYPAGVKARNTASDVDVLRQFGIFGTTAPDCSAPPSSANPHVTYAVDADGELTRTLRTGTAIDATLKMRNAHLLRSDLLEYEETGRQSELKVVMARIDRKFRGWHSVRTSGPETGDVLIDQGILSATGKPTLAFTLCRAN
ncbi:MAG TPA: hypothetical protein VF079_02330 [Sphingomicrobium sp.]